MSDSDVGGLVSFVSLKLLVVSTFGAVVEFMICFEFKVGSRLSSSS